MSRPMRLFHAGVSKYFIVDGPNVYADLDGDGRIASDDRHTGPAVDALVAAAVFFDRFFDAPFPGAKSLDPDITSGGQLNDREAASFARDPKGVLAKRPDLLGHLDFFDRRDRDGMITLAENFRGWRALGYGRLRSVILMLGSAVVFGRSADRFAIDIERIAERRPTGATGIYGPDGNVDAVRLGHFAAIFDQRSTNGVLTHDELRAALAEGKGLGTVPRRQFESLFVLTGHLNHSNTVTREQFLGLFDNTLFWTIASMPDSAGNRTL